MTENELIHFGIPGMKWGRRKQPERSGNNRKTNVRAIEKKNYNIVKNRLKQTGVKTTQLRSYETGRLNNKKIKKYLGQDISMNQVDDYLKRRNIRANVATILGGVAGTSLAAILSAKGLI